ncbi:FecCD family ABC transporter permease [Paludibacterium yongneupense]|uniref:FecCD family ABC transporter permease n=1 Tax=Paludibacterium yongneupense TaxID=400061 RepID=UPI000684FCD8|nr:iron ABC transporter permease [Paludibacterium yongneupense]
MASNRGSRALTALFCLGLILTALASLFDSPATGGIHVGDWLSGRVPPIEHELLWQLRLPRVLLAFCAGALLASAGAAIQARFHNPLAEPGLIGINGGAALAAALALQLGLPTPLVSLSAFGGGLLALSLTRLMSRSTRNAARLILAGVAVNAVFGSLLTLLICTLPDGSLRTITFWLMGSFAQAEWPLVRLCLLAAPVLCLLLYREWRLLNALQLGEEAAWHMGFNVRRGAWRVVVLSALACSLVVSSCGMVGFIGLMAPHLVRQCIGGHSRRLLLLAPLAGGWLALGADWLARSAIYPAELPVGVITSLTGAPFFLWLLWRNKADYDA